MEASFLFASIFRFINEGKYFLSREIGSVARNYFYPLVSLSETISFMRGFWVKQWLGS